MEEFRKRTQELKAIIFDLGGVIYKHRPIITAYVIAKIFARPEEDIGKEYAKYRNRLFTGALTTTALLKILKSKFPTEKSLDDLTKDWVRVYGAAVKHDQGMIEILQSLRKRYKIYLFTNTCELNNRYNKKIGIFDYFDGVFRSFEIKLRKPQLRAYKFVLAAINLKPEECVSIDDKEENLIPARKLGMRTILFDILKNKPEKLKDQLKNFKVVL